MSPYNSHNDHALAQPDDAAAAGPPTLWGLDPFGLHDRFWASCGTQVVRPGGGGSAAATPVADRAGLYLLADARTLAVFHLGPLLDLLHRAPSNVLLVRLRRAPDVGYREIPVTDAGGNLVRLRRTYRQGGLPPARVILVRDPALARCWQQSADARAGRKSLRRALAGRGRRRHGVDGDGVAFDGGQEGEEFVAELVKHWPQPGLVIPDLCRVGDHVWAHRSVRIAPGVRCIGPAWIGAGREIQNVPALLGPAAVWDAPAARPAVPGLTWDALDPRRRRPLRSRSHPIVPPPPPRISKRLFDIAFASLALLLTLPVYPAVMLAIWLEDGRPFFFAHRRETLGGREFPCLKFRSMQKDSEEIKRRIAGHNHADGPQFFIPSDPRLTRVGRLIRKLNLDELPQFFNVLLGHMSVVGPRPSPYKENQYCPAWREARLSVRPGITGLWQVMRTRQQGQDFQEWIRFDLEYVRRAGWLLDLRIIWKTIVMIVAGKRSGP